MTLSTEFPTDKFGPWREAYAWLPSYCLDVRRTVWLRRVFKRYAYLAGQSDVLGLETQYRLNAEVAEQSAS